MHFRQLRRDSTIDIILTKNVQDSKVVTYFSFAGTKMNGDWKIFESTFANLYIYHFTNCNCSK